MANARVLDLLAIALSISSHTMVQQAPIAT
jgi:hypothetical protein